MYVCTDVHDVMAIKPNFLRSMGYHIFLAMVLRARGAPLLFFELLIDFETILIKKINAKRLVQRFDIVEMSLSRERINYKPHICTKIVE